MSAKNITKFPLLGDSEINENTYPANVSLEVKASAVPGRTWCSSYILPSGPATMAYWVEVLFRFIYLMKSNTFFISSGDTAFPSSSVDTRMLLAAMARWVAIHPGSGGHVPPYLQVVATPGTSAGIWLAQARGTH
jgi:hypothetical protein